MEMSQKSKGKRVLLVDDEEATLKALKRVLEKDGFEVATALNGKLAKDLVAMESFDCVLSDVHMPGSHISGIELFEYIKTLPRPAPFILMTGFATLAETKRAHESGVTGFLAKPFKPDELLKILRPACGLSPESQVVVPEQNLDSNYSKLSVDDFVTGKEFQYSVFIRLSSSKYVKVAHQGENLPIDRIRAYKSKGIQYLYLLKEDFQKYLKFNLALLKAVSKVSTVDPMKKANLMKHTGEVILEQLYTDEIVRATLDDARMVLENSVCLLSESEDTFTMVSILNSHSDFLYAHSLGVSFYGVLMAKAMGWTAPVTLYKVSIAGLLHDIGKKEIERSVLDKPRNSLSPEELRLIETHAVRGMEILSRVSGLSDDIIQIVGQHHEREHGSGYPAKLPKQKTHPIARLIAVADEFCKLVIKNPDSDGIDLQTAFRRLSTIHTNSLDNTFIEVLGKVLSNGVPESRSKEGQATGVDLNAQIVSEGSKRLA